MQYAVEESENRYSTRSGFKSQPSGRAAAARLCGHAALTAYCLLPTAYFS